MQNNYFSYGLNRKNNILVILFSFIISIIILFLTGFVLFTEKWEDARLTGEDSGYSDIPTLDRKGLEYFVKTKNQTINNSIVVPAQGDAQSIDDIKNTGN